MVRSLSLLEGRIIEIECRAETVTRPPVGVEDSHYRFVYLHNAQVIAEMIGRRDLRPKKNFHKATEFTFFREKDKPYAYSYKNPSQTPSLTIEDQRYYFKKLKSALGIK